MTDTARRSRLALWLTAPTFGVLVGAFLGAVVGMMIGDAIGDPEGEGFIGFIYGLWIGGAGGLVFGGLIAWWFDRTRRRP